LPVASATVLGGVKQGTGVSIAEDGTLSASGTMRGSTGSTDNALLRADGTGGVTIQSSLVTVDDSGSVNIPSGQHYKINNVNLAAADVGAQPTATYTSVSTTYPLPSAPTVGTIVDIVGIGNVWTATATSNYVIRMGADVSAANGVLTASNGYDCAMLVYIGNSIWVVKSPTGIFTVV
jgi:hypothetical protein